MNRLVRALAGALAAATLPAQAVLGGDVASVQADALRLQGVRRQAAGVLHSRHEIVRPDGARIVEYVNGRGTVFMIEWAQQGKPRMADLLGAFEPTYRAALAGAPSPGARRRLELRAGDLVVHSSAHLNRYRGVAYLRSQMPDGFDAAARR